MQALEPEFFATSKTERFVAKHHVISTIALANEIETQTNGASDDVSWPWLQGCKAKREEVAIHGLRAGKKSPSMVYSARSYCCLMDCVSSL